MDWGDCLDKTVDPTGVASLKCLPVVFSNIVDWTVGLASLVAVLFIIISGIKFLTSGGDPKQVEGARKTMTYAIAGLIIILLAFALIQIIGVITGATCVGLPFGFSNCP
jgi:heme O synthase-like polyprenyltransferase